jgi:hypothetical protein
MANWTEKNRACKTLWTSLRTMNQLFTNFEESGDLKMKDLAFFNSLVSKALLINEATMVADQLDNIFRNGRGAIFEENTDRTKAIGAMVAILVDGEKQVSDLAATVDDAYKFISEQG